MGGLFGHAWASQYGEAPDGVAGDTWAAALADVTPERLAVGLRATLWLGKEFPPNAPRFLALCFGVPTFAAVRYELRNGEVPRTGFGILCWRFVDAYALRRADQREADRIVRDAYELASAHVMAGGELPEVPALLAKPEPECRVAASPETVARVLGELAEKLNQSAADAPAPDAAEDAA